MPCEGGEAVMPANEAPLNNNSRRVSTPNFKKSCSREKISKKCLESMVYRFVHLDLSQRTLAVHPFFHRFGLLAMRAPRFRLSIL